MPRPLLSLIVAWSTFAAPVRADVLDQAFLGTDAGTQASVDMTTLFSRAQTFTVGVSGTLTRLELVLASSATTAADLLTVDVRPTDESGAPLLDDGSALGSAVLAGDTFGGTLDPNVTTEIDLTAFAIAVTAGDRLAIVARSNIPFAQGRLIAWSARIVQEAGYAGGSAWVRASSWSPQDGGGGAPVDLEFRTYVEAPEPSGTAAPALLALAGFAVRRRAVATEPCAKRRRG